MAKRRPNGDGLVRKREDGRWEGRIVAGHKKDGSPIYRAAFAEKQDHPSPHHAYLLVGSPPVFFLTEYILSYLAVAQ